MRAWLDSFPSLVLHSRPLLMMLMVIPNPGRILFSPVEGLVGLLPVLGVALKASVDDVDGGAKPRVGSYSHLLRAWLDSFPSLVLHSRPPLMMLMVAPNPG